MLDMPRENGFFQHELIRVETDQLRVKFHSIRINKGIGPSVVFYLRLGEDSIHKGYLEG